MLFFDAFLTALGILLPLIVVAALMLLLVTLGPRMVAGWRQRAYDETSAAEAVRLTVVPPPGLSPDADLATELIRAMHPRQRRGFGFWRVGWPLVELSVVARGGQLSWEISANRQMAVQIEHGLRALYPGAEISVSRPDRRAATATAVGRLAASSSWARGGRSSRRSRAI
jgi:hypothetical protein